jgi:hypothetical protein
MSAAPRWLLAGGAALAGVAALAWILRGPAILLDLEWLASCF